MTLRNEAGPTGPVSPAVAHTEHVGPFTFEVLSGVRPAGAQRESWVWSVYLDGELRLVIEHGAYYSDDDDNALQVCVERARMAARHAQTAAARVSRPQPDRGLF